ncbi:MAG: Zeta toxin family protein [SAR202 cluster bacterium]|nr:Zeta toxin family protein [SAR202 cluster bacterium]
MTVRSHVSKPPLVVVVAGPNGAGKTSTSKKLLHGALAVNEYVNADQIASGLSAFQPETAAVEAGRVMLIRLKALAKARENFAFETTLASRTFAPWLEVLRASGYRTHLNFVALRSPELAILRVAQRVKNGGHNIPDNTVRRRYVSGLRNFFHLYRPIVDSWQVYDNSDRRGPRLIAHDNAGSEAILDLVAWDNLLEQQK